MKSLNNCFNCTIEQNGNTLLDKDYITLKEISEDIGLSYSIIADISSGRKKNSKYNNFKFMPQIQIRRINKKEYNENKKEYNENINIESN